MGYGATLHPGLSSLQLVELRRLRSRRPLLCSGEVRWAFLEECCQRLLRVRRAHQRTELLILCFYRLLDLFAFRIDHQSLAGTKRAFRLLREPLGSLRCCLQKFPVRYNPGYESQLRGAFGIERLSQEDEFGSADMSYARRNRSGGPKLRHHAQINERQQEPGAFTCVHEIAVRQHGGSTSNSRPMHRCHDWLIEVQKCSH